MPEKTPPADGKPLSQPSTRMIDLKELMGSAKEVHLYHSGQVYRLRLTKANKLILTK